VISLTVQVFDFFVVVVVCLCVSFLFDGDASGSFHLVDMMRRAHPGNVLRTRMHACMYACMHACVCRCGTYARIHCARACM
jgi:hypothetical protein